LIVYADERGLHLEVRDTGIGIAADEQERIFERFVQLKPKGSDVSGGVGLGLAICASIVERHRGRIWVESQPGMGSRFFVELPR
jgi:signal transduction histidine kinase